MSDELSQAAALARLADRGALRSSVRVMALSQLWVAQNSPEHLVAQAELLEETVSLAINIRRICDLMKLRKQANKYPIYERLAFDPEPDDHTPKIGLYDFCDLVVHSRNIKVLVHVDESKNIAMGGLRIKNDKGNKNVKLAPYGAAFGYCRYLKPQVEEAISRAAHLASEPLK